MRLFGRQPETTDTHELLRRIEARDNMFRLAQTLFFVVLTGASVFLVAFSFQIQSANHQLLTTLSNNSKARTTQINELQSHIDCIVSLFGEPDRASLVISDIENCKLTATQ